MRAEAVGGPIFTRAYKVLLAIGILGILITIWRFWVGLGASTALSDGYPLGIWIAFDVVTGTALACGGYAVALLVYIFNRGKYHPLVRPAILTSALGYSIAGVSVAIDLGRPWNMWKIPLYFRSWNLNSALLEVALCIMAYVGVLWVELSPALLEKWSWPPAKRISAIVDRLLIWIIALGMLLPTMHQSSLGSLMLLAGPKLHALWNSPFLPLFFLITCVAMGYSIVVFESTFSSIAFKRKPETALLVNLQRIAATIGVVFVAGRLLDLLVRGQFGFALRLDVYGIFFWIENVLFILPMLMTKRNANLGMLFRSAMVLAVAGALFRFDTYLLAFDSGPGWHYFPSVAELLITIGLVAFELAIYIALVKRFPILSGAAPAPAH